MQIAKTNLTLTLHRRYIYKTIHFVNFWLSWTKHEGVSKSSWCHCWDSECQVVQLSSTACVELLSSALVHWILQPHTSPSCLNRCLSSCKCSAVCDFLMADLKKQCIYVNFHFKLGYLHLKCARQTESGFFVVMQKSNVIHISGEAFPVHVHRKWGKWGWTPRGC